MFTEYPRPQLKRNSFLNLNGEWLLNESPIQVPYPPESKLSCFSGNFKDLLFYSKKFTLPNDFKDDIKNGKHLILHFGSVDQIAQVYVDGSFVGMHEGGYLPFSFDITKFLSSEEIHEIQVDVKDGLNKFFPYGKQSKTSHGMWYTKVSGIWQTVWAETVSENHISKIKITPKTKEKNELKIFASYTKDENFKNQNDEVFFEIDLPCPNGNKICKKFNPKDEISIELEKEFGFELWNTENPKLYDFTLSLFVNQNKVDQISSYFALREISISKIDDENFILLNGEKIFLNAVLDQGYFPDGIFLPETEKDFEKDILNLKKLGFNTLRKHIKIEPEIFYYLCDKNGMLVMQDMVQNGSYKFFRDTAFPSLFCKKGKKKHIGKGEKSISEYKGRKHFFIKHSLETIEHLYNHPSIIYWTIFNEGWGQFDANSLYKIVKDKDKTRIVDSASGWFNGCKSDVESEHIYFKVIKLDKILEKCKKKNKILIISECGGFTLKIDGHNSSEKISYGYGKCKDRKELTEKIQNLYDVMIKPYTKKGLCGCVYTQITDVENEINGLFSYDRQVCKVNKTFEVEV